MVALANKQPVADPLVAKAIEKTKNMKRRSAQSRMQVGPYFVQGNGDYAEVVERRMGKDFVVKSFNTNVTDPFQKKMNGVDSKGSDSYKVAVEWAIDNG